MDNILSVFVTYGCNEHLYGYPLLAIFITVDSRYAFAYALTISKSSAFLILMMSISVVTYLYQQYIPSITHARVTSFTIRNSDLGLLKEGETKTYDKTQIETLEDAIRIQVDDSVSHVYLDIDSDLNQIDEFYSIYDIVVKFSDVIGDTYSTGDDACTLSIGSKDYSSIELDAPGIWSFDLEISVTAKSVDEDTPSSVTLNVSAEEH